MPLPLLIPFAIKGALIVGKIIVAKGATAKVAVATVKTAKVIGTANTIAGATVACAVVGGVSWSATNIDRAQSAYSAATDGDLATASRHLIAMANSIHGVFTDGIAGELQSWGADGYPVDARVLQLAQHAYRTASST